LKIRYPPVNWHNYWKSPFFIFFNTVNR
jgi:hypothetical protein